MFKPGDKFKRLTPNKAYGWKVDDIFTCARINAYGDPVDLSGFTHVFSNVVKVMDRQNPDIQQFMDDVEAGRIRRGGVQSKFVVYTNDAGDTIIQLFKQ